MALSPEWVISVRLLLCFLFTSSSSSTFFLFCVPPLSLCLKKSIKFVGITLPSHLFNFFPHWNFVTPLLRLHFRHWHNTLWLNKCQGGAQLWGPAKSQKLWFQAQEFHGMLSISPSFTRSLLWLAPWCALWERCEKVKKWKKTTFLVLTCLCTFLQSSRRSACWSDCSWIQKDWVSAFS